MIMSTGEKSAGVLAWQRGVVDSACGAQVLTEASVKLGQTFANVLASQTKVSNSTDSELHHAMEMVMLDARELSDEFQSGAFGNVAEPLNIDTLAELRRQLNRERGSYRSAQARVERLKLLSYYLEGVRRGARVTT